MLKGWRINGQELPLEEIGRELQVGGWPVAVLVQALEDSQELQSRDWRTIRASELGRCLRQRALKRQKEFWLSPDDVWLPLVGRGVHLELSRLASRFFSPEEVILEYRFSHSFPLDGEELVITGQVDFYHRPSGTMVDYKTTGSVFYKSGEAWEYQVQQNVYAQLLRWAGEKPQRSWLWFVEPRRERGRVRHKLVEVELWPEEDVVALLEELGRIIILAHRDKILPPAFRPEDEGFWQCRFCPVLEVCQKLQAQEKVVPHGDGEGV